MSIDVVLIGHCLERMFELTVSDKQKQEPSEGVSAIMLTPDEAKEVIGKLIEALIEQSVQEEPPLADHGSMQQIIHQIIHLRDLE